MSDVIRILKGPDRVRLRPAVMFGSVESEGVINCIKLLLNIFINEAVNCRSDGLSVKVLSDGSVEIISLDRGFIIDDTEAFGHPDWYNRFCELYAGPRSEDYIFSVGEKKNTLYAADDELTTFCLDVDGDFEVCCAQYASEAMTIASKRDGVFRSLYFEKGYFVNKDIEVSDFSTGTYIKFKPDAEVFGEYSVKASDFKDFLFGAAITVKDFKCELCDESGYNEVFYFKNGVEDYFKALLSDGAPIYMNTIEANGRERYDRPEYPAKVTVTVGIADSTEFIKCYHNFREIQFGGSHFEAVKEKLVRHLSNLLETDSDWDCIKKHVVLTVESYCPENRSKYKNATKKAIDNRLICEIADDVLSSDFMQFLKNNKDYIKKVFDVK